METWSGGGCTHRCDGIYDAVTGIECDPDSPAHKAAKPTTRLSVMLRDVESMGVWRMESHGYNAAAEIPAMADLAMFVGDLVPAVLHLVERRAVKDGKTSRFVVPVLDLLVSKARLVELASRGGAPVAIAEAPAPAAIAAGPAVNWAELLEDATTPDECRAIWAQAGQAGALTPDLQEAIKAKAAALTQPQAAEPAGPADVDDLWFRIVAAAGGRGLTDSAMREAFERDFGHPVAEGNVAELEAFLHFGFQIFVSANVIVEHDFDGQPKADDRIRIGRQQGVFRESMLNAFDRADAGLFEQSLLTAFLFVRLVKRRTNRKQTSSPRRHRVGNVVSVDDGDITEKVGSGHSARGFNGGNGERAVFISHCIFLSSDYWISQGMTRLQSSRTNIDTPTSYIAWATRVRRDGRT
jgi:hypothetical protein